MHVTLEIFGFEYCFSLVAVVLFKFVVLLQDALMSRGRLVLTDI